MVLGLQIIETLTKITLYFKGKALQTVTSSTSLILYLYLFKVTLIEPPFLIYTRSKT